MYNVATYGLSKFWQLSILSEEGVIVYNNNELDEMGDTIYNAILLL